MRRVAKELINPRAADCLQMWRHTVDSLKKTIGGELHLQDTEPRSHFYFRLRSCLYEVSDPNSFCMELMLEPLYMPLTSLRFGFWDSAMCASQLNELCSLIMPDPGTKSGRFVRRFFLDLLVPRQMCCRIHAFSTSCRAVAQDLQALRCDSVAFFAQSSTELPIWLSVLSLILCYLWALIILWPLDTHCSHPTSCTDRAGTQVVQQSEITPLLDSTSICCARAVI